MGESKARTNREETTFTTEVSASEALLDAREPMQVDLKQLSAGLVANMIKQVSEPSLLLSCFQVPLKPLPMLTHHRGTRIPAASPRC